MTGYDLLVVLIVAGAAGFVLRTFLRRFKRQETASCGCSSCSLDPACCETPRDGDACEAETKAGS